MMRMLVVALLFVTWNSSVAAEVPLRQRVVDVFVLQNGTRLFGTLLTTKGSKDVEILIRGAWLRAHFPELLTELEEQDVPTENPSQNEIVTLLTEHLKQLRASGDTAEERIGYLTERLENLRRASDQHEPHKADIIILSLPAQLIRRQLLQNAQRRRLAGLAILNQINDCEEQSAADVQRQLQQIPLSQLRQDLPGKTPNDAQLQFHRLLLNADRIFGKTCRLILQSGRYVAEDNASGADLQLLAAQMLTGQIQSQLQELLSEDFTKPAGANANSAAAAKPSAQLDPRAAAIANQQRADVVEVTEMQVTPASGAASVRISVYYQLPKDLKWRLITHVDGQATTSDISEAQQQRIADDPRVKQITQLFSGLGTGGRDLTSAISAGACVEVAQKRAREQLTAFMTAPAGGNGSAGISVLRAALSANPVFDDEPK